MNVKEAVDKIKALMAEAPKVEAEAPKVETVAEAAKDAEVVDLTEGQALALSQAIDAVKESFSEQVKALNEQISALTAENKSIKESFSKNTEAVGQILALVEKMSEQPTEKAIEQPKTAFNKVKREEREARFAKVADTVKAMREYSIKN
jgi:hypothetical protein